MEEKLPCGVSQNALTFAYYQHNWSRRKHNMGKWI